MWLAALAVLVAGGLGATVAWALSGSGNTTGAAPSAAAPAGTTESPQVKLAVAQAAMSECRTALTAGETAAAAAKASAADWTTHTEAQRKLDSGSNTEEQTRAEWNASKAQGEKDVADFRAAQSTWETQKEKCASIVTMTAGGPMRTQAEACDSRAAAIAGAVAAGTPVNDQWAEHLDMMAHKEHTTTAEYRDRWRGMVEKAVPLLAEYTRAAEALAAAPACT